MRWLPFVALVVLLGHGGLARAQSPSVPGPPATENGASRDRELERSRLLVEAQRAHEGGQHEIALGLASKAVSIRESAALWRFIAEQHWLLGNSGAARRASERCLARIAMEPPSANRAAVEQGCRFIQAQTAASQSSSAAPADQERHTSSLTAKDGNGQAGTRAVPARRRRWFERKTWPIMAIGVGLSALVTAAIARLVADGWYRELKRQCQGAAGCPEDWRKIQDRVRDFDSLSAGLAVGGTVVAALGVTGILVSGSRDPVGRGARLEVIVPF